MTKALEIVRRHIAMAAPPFKTNHVQVFVDQLRKIEAELEAVEATHAAVLKKAEEERARMQAFEADESDNVDENFWVAKVRAEALFDAVAILNGDGL